MRAKFINEIFTADSDPIRDLGIGAEYIANEFKEKLFNKLPWLSEEDLFLYKKDENMIEINCWPLSYDGIKDLRYEVLKLIKKYENILKVIYMPSSENAIIKINARFNDLILKIKIF